MLLDFQFRRFNNLQSTNYIGREGTISFNLETKVLNVHDGVTQGGHSMVTNSFVES